MSKRDSKGNSSTPPDHVRLYEWLMQSAAWKDLSTNARALYVLIKQQYKGMNNGRLILSIRQVSEALHVSKTTAAKAFAELGSHGFIEVVIRGSFQNRKDRRATEWRLTEHLCNVSGELPSKLFMKWRPGMNFTVCGKGQMVRGEGHMVLHGEMLQPNIPRTVRSEGL